MQAIMEQIDIIVNTGSLNACLSELLKCSYPTSIVRNHFRLLMTCLKYSQRHNLELKYVGKKYKHYCIAVSFCGKNHGIVSQCYAALVEKVTALPLSLKGPKRSDATTTAT